MKAPNYRWVCFKCGSANEPHTDRCAACQFSANASASQIKTDARNTGKNSIWQGLLAHIKNGTSLHRFALAFAGIGSIPGLLAFMSAGLSAANGACGTDCMNDIEQLAFVGFTLFSVSLCCALASIALNLSFERAGKPLAGVAARTLTRGLTSAFSAACLYLLWHIAND